MSDHPRIVIPSGSKTVYQATIPANPATGRPAIQVAYNWLDGEQAVAEAREQFRTTRDRTKRKLTD